MSSPTWATLLIAGDWVGLAQILADGGATEFSQRIDRREFYGD